MPARQKLNCAYFSGCLALSAVLGLFAQSWPAFLAALAATVGIGLHSGGLRPAPEVRNRNRPRPGGSGR